MSKIEVNTVEQQCGTTLTLGGSGDTVTLGSGASQSGFGRTGTVDWVQLLKTSPFTAKWRWVFHKYNSWSDKC